MNSKRIISLILSIIMTLQVFVFQTPVHAMEGASPTTQKSEGQKTNERTEEFAFKNTKKSKMSWFNSGTMSTYRARSASTTRTETLKIETTAKGLDNGEKAFDWEAFGQNKKFRAWIEVAYEEDKKTGEKVASERNKVSKDFEISSEGNIDAEVTLDASKTVDYYYLMTEYDNNDSLVKINAIFDYKNSFSPKNQADLTFKIGIQQIVSTTITYNLIDEYGKAIDIADEKEEKPADTDLENLAKFGNGTDEPLLTFNLKNNGTDILREEQIDDEDELIDGSIKLIVEEKAIKSGGIDYKLTSTYDVLNGGKVTIQRQKDVVTPKDPHNPGEIPEGYARIKLVADEKGNGSKGTFTKDDATDTTRVVDVKAGKPYTIVQAEVDKQGKPFPLTDAKKVDTGKTFDKWAPALNTLGDAVAKETKILNATYKSSDVDIIPYLPGEEVPTKDKDGLPIPKNYLTITFKSEDAAKGKVKIDDKVGETVLAKVKPGIDLSTKAEITTKPEENYGFTKWDPELGVVNENKTFTAHFIKSGDKINEGDPIPKGWFKVTVSQDQDSIKSGTVTKAIYTVKPNDKLGQDKFANLEGKANDGFKDPAWYVGSEKLEKPYEKGITTSTDFIARATEEIANKFKTNGLKAKDIIAYKGDKIEGKFWNKGVTTQREDAVLERILESATVTDTTDPVRTTEKAGTFPGTLKVTFEDGSSLEVSNQGLIVIDTKVDIDYDKDSNKDANAPRHKDEVVKGKIKSDEALEGAKVEILDSENNVIGITLAKADGSFIAGTRELKAGETIKVRVTLPKAGKASDPVEKVVKLNADRLKDLLPIAKAQSTEFGKKQNAIIKAKLDALNTAITEAEKLVDKNYKAVGADTAENQKAIDNAVTALEKALKELTANIPPTISGPKTHEIFVDEALDLKGLVDVTDGDGSDDLVVENGSNVKIAAVKVDGQTETPVTDLSTINTNVGTYKVTYTAKDKAGAEVTHEMTLTVKPRTNSAIEVTTDPSKMSYLITEKDGKTQLDLKGMTLNLVDNLGKKTKVELTDSKVKLKVNGREVTNGAELTLKDDVQFIEVEYTPEGSQTPLTAKTNGVLRVGPDYDKDGKDDRTQDFDEKNISKLEVIKQPQLDYIAKDKSEADKVFKLNLNDMIVRMTDKAGKEKLAVVKEGKFYDYDEQTKEIKGLTATPAHGATLTPETAENVKGDNGKKVAITGPNNSKAETEPLKVFYDANKDGKPDHGQDQKTPAPSAMARNVGENPQGTTVEGMATPGAVIKITDKDGAALTTEPTEVKAGPDGKYTATIKPILADGTDIKVTAKLGEMGESDPTPTTVFDDKNDNKQPDKDEGFNIAKATEIKFVDEPDLTYLVPSKDKEVTFDGKDGKGKAIYLELSYKNGDKTESKIMTLEDLMKDTEHISVTPAKGTTDKKENQTHDLVGKNLEVKLVKVDPATETSKATSTSKFAIEIDANGNGVADKDEKSAKAEDVKALNQNKVVDGKVTNEPKDTTTVTGKVTPGSTVKITDEDGKDITPKDVTIDENGNFTAEVTKQEEGKKVKVVVTEPGKQDSDPAEATVARDANNDGKADSDANQKTATPSAKALNVGEKPEFTTITGKAEKGATVIAKVDGVEVGKATADAQTGEYKIEAKKDNAALPKDTEVKVTAQVEGKLVSDPTATVVKVDKDGNGIDDDKEKFDIKKATKVEIIKNPDKMNYSVTEKTGKTPFDATGVIIRLTDASGKTATYTYADITSEANKNNFTLSPADKEQIGLKEDGSVNTIPFKVTVIGAETKPSVTAEQNITVILDKDGNGEDDRTEKTAEPDVIARNIGKDPQKTTVELETQPKAKVTIEYTDKDGQPKKIENLTAGEDGKLTQEITPKLEKDTPVKVTVQDGEKQPTEKTVKVFDDLDNNKIPDTQAGQTERPAAIASNIGKKPEFTTITGEAEKGATVTAKVGTEVVGTATADSTTGKYTIEAKQNDAPIKEGVKIDVTAKLEPKAGSEKQTVVVFNDTDGTGQPDSAKDFDPKKTTKMQVVSSPDKMVYSDGEELNLDGLKVLLTDVNGNQKIFTYKHDNNTEFTNAGLSVDLKQKTVLSSKDYDSKNAKDGHNGRKLLVTLDTTGNTQVTEALTDKTPTALTVNKDQSAQPTDLVAANQGENPTETKIKGKAQKGDTVKIYAPGQMPGKDQPIKTVEVTKEDGTFETSVSTGDENNKQPYPVGTKFKVTATESGKSESAPQEATVIVDKNSDWIDDNAGKVELPAPQFDDVKVGDKDVKVVTPTDPKITKIIVKDGSGKTVEVVKDGNDWKIGDKKVPEEGRKLVIPTKDNNLTFGPNETVEVTVKDAADNKGTTTKATKPADLPKMPNPTVDSLSTESRKITGKTEPGSKVLVYLPGDTEDTAKEASVLSDGRFVLNLEEGQVLVDKTDVKVTAENSSKFDGKGETKVKVGLDLNKLEATDKDADKLIKESKPNNFDPTNNDYDKNLEEKSKAAKEILEKAKDNKDDNDPSQSQVNKAEEDLRDAINQKKADDKVKVVEKLVKEGQKPSEDQIKEAQEAIDKVEDPKAKQDLQDRLDKAKLIDELVKVVEKTPTKENDPNYNTKPSDIKKEVEKAKEEAEKVIKDYKEGTNTAEKSPEVAKDELEKAIENYNKEQVVISFSEPIAKSRRLSIHSLQKYVEVEIYIDGVRQIKNKTLHTSSVGELIITLPEQLESGQEVKIIGRKTGLLDGESILNAK